MAIEGKEAPSLDSFDEELADEIKGRVKPELRAGERLIWAGYGNPSPPAQSPRELQNRLVLPLVTTGLLLVGAILLLGAFEGFGKTYVIKHEEAGLALMFGLISTSCGFLCLLGMIAGWLPRRDRGHREHSTVYALTDRRAIVWKPRKGSQGIEVRTYPRGQFTLVRRVEYPDGSGDVICEAGQPNYWSASLFEGIAEVRRVEEMFRSFLIISEATS